MSAAAPTISRHQFQSLIIERAWKNPEFKREFTANPKATIEKYTGQKLPDNLNVAVHQEDANTMHITIPLAPKNMAELSDTDLETVAGGTEINPYQIGTAIPNQFQNPLQRAGW